MNLTCGRFPTGRLEWSMSIPVPPGRRNTSSRQDLVVSPRGRPGTHGIAHASLLLLGRSLRRFPLGGLSVADLSNRVGAKRNKISKNCQKDTRKTGRAATQEGSSATRNRPSRSLAASIATAPRSDYGGAVNTSLSTCWTTIRQASAGDPRAWRAPHRGE